VVSEAAGHVMVPMLITDTTLPHFVQQFVMIKFHRGASLAHGGSGGTSTIQTPMISQRKPT
jgi:hypothetical protein